MESSLVLERAARSALIVHHHRMGLIDVAEHSPCTLGKTLPRRPPFLCIGAQCLCFFPSDFVSFISGGLLQVQAQGGGGEAVSGEVCDAQHAWGGIPPREGVEGAAGPAGEGEEGHGGEAQVRQSNQPGIQKLIPRRKVALRNHALMS